MPTLLLPPKIFADAAVEVEAALHYCEQIMPYDKAVESESFFFFFDDEREEGDPPSCDENLLRTWCSDFEKKKKRFEKKNFVTSS